MAPPAGEGRGLRQPRGKTSARSVRCGPAESCPPPARPLRLTLLSLGPQPRSGETNPEVPVSMPAPESVQRPPRWWQNASGEQQLPARGPNWSGGRNVLAVTYKVLCIRAIWWSLSILSDSQMSATQEENFKKHPLAS